MTAGKRTSTRLMAWAAWLLAIPPLWLFITTPMSVANQGLLGLASVVVMMLANWLRPDSRRISLWLMLLSVVVSSRYLYWRATDTLVFNSGLETLLGYGLFLAELYAWVILLFGYLQTLWPLERPIVPLPEDMSRWPKVDIYIPTYNESIAVVMDTVLAAQNMDYPRDRMQIYILDDGRREAFAHFADRAGVGYITRSDNQHAKAGNLNNALTQTDGELICIFDCDHVPTRAFLQSTLGGFLEDDKLALVQTPHYFYSPDPFERNLSVAEELPREGELFYGPVQKGNDFWNATFFCGSCAVIRRQALEDTDGFAVETVTEDAHTALKLQRKGWRTAFLGLPLAAGLATERLTLHIGQRARWARGMTQIMRRDNPLFGPGLSMMQRLCYLNAMLHFQFALPRVVFLTAPLAYLLLGQNVIASSAMMIFAYALPHLAHAIYTNSRLTGRYRYSFWGEIYETVLAFHLIKPTLVTLFDPKRGKFNVTEKGGLLEKAMFDYHAVRPHLIAAFLLAAGIGWGVVRLYWNEFYGIERDVMLLNLFWAGFSLLTLLAAIAVARERKQTRTTVRIPVDLPALLYLDDGRQLVCRTADISMGGVRLVSLPEPELSAEVRAVEVRVGDHSVVMPAQLVVASELGVRLKFNDYDLDQRRRLVRVVMGRADAWLPDHEHPRDRPLRSLWAVIRAIAGLFFTSWMQHTPARDADERSGRFWRWVTRITLFVLVVMLVLLAIRPVLAQDDTAEVIDNIALTPAPRVGMQRAVSLREMGQPEGLLLRGDGSQAGVSFPVRSDKLVQSASLRLRVKHSPWLLPRRGTLRIELNGRLLDTLDLSDGSDAVHDYELGINPAQLVGDNRLNFRLNGTADELCHDPLDERIWASVMADSVINMSLTQLPLVNDLSLFPRPFLDKGTEPVQLPVVFGAMPETDSVRAAAIVTSWFGVRAGYRGARFAVQFDALPQDSHALVFSTDAHPVRGLDLPEGEGPRVLVMDNPLAPNYKLLVLHAAHADELVQAARFLVFRSGELLGQQMPAEPVQVGGRSPHDAPNWVDVSRPLQLGELVPPRQLRVSGVYPGLINVSFRAAPNLFQWPGETVPLSLNYRFPEGDWLDEEHSTLDVALNGQHLASLPVNRRGLLEQTWGWLGGRTRQEHTVIPVSPELIHGQNRLSFYFNLQYRKPTVCNAGLPTDVVSQVSPESFLDMTHVEHATMLPNLSYFVAAGYPFSRYADLSTTALALPAQPDEAVLSAAFDLMARIGEATGHPAHAIAVALGSEALQREADRHWLVVSDFASPLVNSVLQGSRLYPQEDRLRVYQRDGWGRLSDLVRGDLHLQTRAADRALTGRTQVQGLFSMPSPLNDRRWVVLVGAADTRTLPPLVQWLGSDAVATGAQDDVVLVDNASKMQSYRVGPRHLHGELSLPARLQWIFNSRPVVVLVLLFGILLWLVMLMYPRWHLRERMRLGRVRSDQQDGR